MTCGTCTFCCRAMGVTELAKPEDTWCTFVRRKPSGCSIYDERPQSCRDFKCYWLSTQETDKPMPVEFRPDKSRCMIIEIDPQRIIARCDPREPLAFRKQPMWTFLYSCAMVRKVYVLAGARLFKIHPAYENVPGGFTEVSEDTLAQIQSAMVREMTTRVIVLRGPGAGCVGIIAGDLETRIKIAPRTGVTKTAVHLDDGAVVHAELKNLARHEQGELPL